MYFRGGQGCSCFSDRYEAEKRHTALRPVYTCDFSCDFDAILRTKLAPAYPARVFSRVTLPQNTARLAEIRKKGVFK